MNRRKYLKSAFGFVGIVSVAGCSSQSSSYSEHINTAQEAIRNAEEKIQTEANKFNSENLESGGVNVQTAAIYDYLDTAEEQLDAAESSASQSQKESIEATQNWISFAREFTAFLDIFAEDYSQASSGFVYIQSERYSDAVDELSTAEDTLSRADEQLTITEDAWNEMDRSKLEDVEDISIAEIENSFLQINEVISVFIPMVSGMSSLSEGLVDYLAGSNAYDAGRYTEAENKFRAAAEDFTVSHSTLKEQEDDAPESMKNSMIELTCYSGAIRDASTHFANAAEATQNGNRSRANEEAQKADEATDRCSF
jgi:hypothetical protein